MKQDKKTTNKSGCTAVLAAAMIAAGGFSAYAGNQGTHGGEWKDTESLRWEWQNGEMSFYGNGSIFSEQHPEISDPEYYLKEAVRAAVSETYKEYLKKLLRESGIFTEAQLNLL